MCMQGLLITLGRELAAVNNYEILLPVSQPYNIYIKHYTHGWRMDLMKDNNTTPDIQIGSLPSVSAYIPSAQTSTTKT
jgi:hypothetical protein